MDTKEIHDGEFAALSALTSTERYELFLRRAADWEQVWTLEADDQMPSRVWPHRRFAEACRSDCRDQRAVAVDVHEWIAALSRLPKESSSVILVFPTQSDSGAEIESAQVCADLLAELDQYE